MEVFRHKWSEKWEARAKQFEPDESEVKSCMPERLRDILKPKRLLLWKGMLSDLGHKDMGVFDEVVEGTNLLGQVPPLQGFTLKHLLRYIEAQTTVALERNVI